MATPPTPRPEAVTPAQFAAFVAQVEALQAAWALERRQLTLRIQDLEQQLAGRHGGASSPTPDALSLFGELPPPAAVTAPHHTSRVPRAPGGRTPHTPRPLDPALPRELVRVPDPPDVHTRGLMPGFVEVLEVLARRPGTLFVKRYERQVWVSTKKTAPLTTPWPTEIWPRAHVHVSVVAHIATARFAGHVPYYRQAQELERIGIHLPRSTQVDLMAELDRRLAPLAAELRRQVLASGYVHVDATPLDCCDRTRPGKAQTSHVWTYRARSPDPAVHGLLWYDFQLTKTPKEPARILRTYHGVVQTDGASGLDALGPPERITHLGCWAHARRYFVDAVESGDARAVAYRAQVDRLFRYDARVRARLAAAPAEHRAALAERLAMWRPRFSRPLADALFTRAATELVRLPPKTALAVAFGYLLGQRASLMRCVTTPGAVLDHNSAENAIRPLKLGARNWLFIGHPDAGPRLASLFTVIENARQAKLDIEAYLTDLLTRFTGAHPAAWLPRAWQRARSDGILA